MYYKIIKTISVYLIFKTKDIGSVLLLSIRLLVWNQLLFFFFFAIFVIWVIAYQTKTNVQKLDGDKKYLYIWMLISEQFLFGY